VTVTTATDDPSLSLEFRRTAVRAVVGLETKQLTPEQAGLVEKVEILRKQATAALDQTARAALGQFMTPPPVSGLMASMLRTPNRDVRLLDAGAGSDR
jgi:type I restriction-modification system DNA methylase subunit